MKQVLSVADFAMILQLVDRELWQYERPIEPIIYYGDSERAKERTKERKIELEKERKERLKTPHYLNLKHLKESLQNLNIEVETPDVEIKVGGESE